MEEIAPGLGARRFFRVHLDGAHSGAHSGTEESTKGATKTQASLIARVEPSDPPADAVPEPRLTPLLRVLAGAGLPVPAVIAADADESIVLLEDMGATSLEDLAREATPTRRVALYAEATALVPRLQRVTAPAGTVTTGLEAFTRRLDAALIATKAEKFTRWSLPILLGRAPTPAEVGCVATTFALIAREAEAAPQRLAHRDLKAANLHLRAGPSGRDELAMIDLQGAFMAAPEYDLVCLLRDAHVALPEDEVRAHAERTRQALPDDTDADTFWRRFDLLSVVRVAKDVSHYLHASTTRGDHRYLAFVPNALVNLKRAAGHSAERDPQFAPLAHLVAELPASLPGPRGARA